MAAKSCKQCKFYSKTGRRCQLTAATMAPWGVCNSHETKGNT